MSKIINPITDYLISPKEFFTNVEEMKADTITSQRFTPEEREALEVVCRLARDGAQAQFTFMNSMPCYTTQQNSDVLKKAIEQIITVRAMLGGEENENSVSVHRNG